MSIKKKDVDLFQDLISGEMENFVLVEIDGRPTICADLGEDEDPDFLPLYVKLSAEEAKKAKEILDEEEDEDEDEDDDDEDAPRSGTKQAAKRWKP